MVGEPVGVVAGDPERAASQHGDVVGLARVADAPVVGGDPVVSCQRVQDGSVLAADDRVVPLAFHDNEEHMVVLRESLRSQSGVDGGDQADDDRSIQDVREHMMFAAIHSGSFVVRSSLVDEKRCPLPCDSNV